jgi:hypothetical protein
MSSDGVRTFAPSDLQQGRCPFAQISPSIVVSHLFQFLSLLWFEC